MNSAHLPADHPEVKTPKIGVIIANLGTPDGTDYWSMRRYLNEFLSDRRVVNLPPILWQPLLKLVILTTRPSRSGKAYASIWNNDKNESPLRTITRDQTEAVRKKIDAIYNGDVIVDFAMRYGNPSMESVVAKMQKQGCQRIVFFPLYPQYSMATTATANDQMFRALMKMTWQPTIRSVAPYYEHPLYIKALANSVRKAYKSAKKTPEKLIVSYHGVPKKFLMDGDPYHCQCHKTTRLLAEELGWDKSQIMTTFQSRFGPAEWLQPYTVEEVARQAEAGVKNIAVIAPAFSADCIETLEEINEEIFESFEEAGGEGFTYIPCLNDNPDHIKMIMDILKSELSGWV